MISHYRSPAPVTSSSVRLGYNAGAIAHVGRTTALAPDQLSTLP
jgi:hypothetical protein